MDAKIDWEASSTSLLAIYNLLPEDLDVKPLWVITPEIIDTNIPWGYFDGSAQENDYGGGEILHIDNIVNYRIKFGIGRTTNNFVELSSLKHLLFARELNYQKIQIFGDSKLTINWTNEVNHCHLHTLRYILTNIISLKSQFDSFVCLHIYRERNDIADHHSKEAVQLNRGQCQIQEFREGTFYNYYHRPFMDINDHPLNDL